MIAKLWANEIISGNKTFEQVPRLLKDKVRAILIEGNRQDLIIE